MSGDEPVSTSSVTVPVPTRARVSYLDGLRGVAALVVLCDHLALVFSPALVLGHSVPHQPAIQYWFATTPIVDLLVSGNFAVCVFYCLSAMALASKPMRMSSGHVQRVTVLSAALRRPPRLAIPTVTANLAACAVLAWLTGPARPFLTLASPHVSWLGTWVSGHSPNFMAAAHDGLLGVFTAPTTPVDLPLWTMHSELQGSFLVFLVLLAPWRWLRLVAYPLLGVLFWEQYLFAFILGLVICEVRTLLLGHAVSPLVRWSGYLLASAAGSYGLLLGSIPSTTPEPPASYYALVPFLVSSDAVLVGHVIGAACLLVAVVTLPPLHALLSSSVARFLGRISFGFYLLHFPVLMSVGIATSLWCQGLLGYIPFHPLVQFQAAAVAVVVTFAGTLSIALVFTRVVDEPLVYRLSKLVAKGRARLGSLDGYVQPTSPSACAS
ncbi:MAG: hypothetical protein C5B60_04340 [Chloroflexi bacterium]|nr:MAG: hypothetical protein C5B60_04340 [Chloroflexota bacterium]